RVGQARQRALGCAGRRDGHRRARGGSRRPLRRLRAGLGRRRVPVRTGVLQAAASRRCDRARREPDGGRAADRGRSRGVPPRGANRGQPGGARLPAGAAGAGRGPDGPERRRSRPRGRHFGAGRSRDRASLVGASTRLGRMILYDAARCPYCARVRIVLAEKGLGYETVEIDLSDRPAWLYTKNPSGKVPVLEEDRGFVLPESLVIMEYLEERFPEPPFWPADPAERALGRLWLDRFDVRLGGDYYALRRGAQSELDTRLHELDAALEAQQIGRAHV